MGRKELVSWCSLQLASEIKPHVPPSKQATDKNLKYMVKTSEVEKRRKSVQSAGEKEVRGVGGKRRVLEAAD